MKILLLIQNFLQYFDQNGYKKCTDTSHQVWIRIGGFKNLRLPAIMYYLCNCWINIIWNFKTLILEPNSSNNLHWVQTFPWDT